MKKSILSRVMALALAIIMLAALVACGGKPTVTDPTTPSAPSPPTNPSQPTQPSQPTNPSTPAEPTVQERCEKAWQEFYDSKNDSGFIGDGLVIYCEGEYYAIIGNTLHKADAITEYDYAGAGNPINISVALFRGIPYVAVPNNGPDAAKACNRYLTVTVDGEVRYVSFYAVGTDSIPEYPSFITLYAKDGVEISQGMLGQIFALEPVETSRTIKNIIFMVADGGGYDNFTLADKVKQEMTDRGIASLAGAKTSVSTNLLSPLGIGKTEGLYLNQFLVGSANTLLWNSTGDPDNIKSYITDSAAAGTALSSGYKTRYSFMGIDPDSNPRASISELARLNGMSTGLVTTKSFVDATPMAFFTSHAIHRYEYQDNSMQALLSGIDVVIAEGTEFGDLYGTSISSHPDLSASSAGYTVAKSKMEMLIYADNPEVKKLWAAILGVNNSGKTLKTTPADMAGDHISYDISASTSDTQPSLLEMTQAALQVLGTNIDNPNGFFLMIEGGALDNAAEPGCLRAAIGEYLAFDEAFGYCVNWAAQRGDTIVVAVPDHDSGGFYGIEGFEDVLIDGIITGKIGSMGISQTTGFNDILWAVRQTGADTTGAGIVSGHTEMAVPISLYAPDEVKDTLLTNMGLPTSGNVRLGDKEYYVPHSGNSVTWYESSALNNDFTIDNTAITPALVKTVGLGSLEDATRILFNEVGHADGTTFDGVGRFTFDDTLYQNTYSQFHYATYQNGNFSVDRNGLTYTLDGETYEIPKAGNLTPKPIFLLDERLKPQAGTFYLPASLYTAAGLGWSITISGEGLAYDKVLVAEGQERIVLPDAPEGMQAIYTDGVKAYNPGDVVEYAGGNLNLTVFVK